MMTVTIYQINMERDTNRLAFSGWNEFERQGLVRPPAELYDRIYSYQTETETPEGVFECFNLRHPADYKGRSLSPSDVVEFILDTGERNHFFCDRFSFQPVEFYSFLVGTENDFPKRLELIKGNRSARETLMDEIVRRISADDNYPSREGKTLIQAYTDKDPEGILIALSGWELESLVKLAFGEEF